MPTDGDGIDEALQGTVNVAVMTAARVGEQLARAREESARRAQARGQQAAREYAARLRAERDAARAQLSVVNRREWWRTARAEDVAQAFQTARAWRDIDPVAAAAEQRIVQEIQERYSLDVTTTGDPAVVGEAVDRARQTEATQHRATAAEETTEAMVLLETADAIDAGVEAAEEARAAEDHPATEPQEAYLRGVGLHPGRDLTFEEATTILSAYEQGDLRRNAPAEEVEKLLRAEMGEASPAGVDEHQAVDRTPGGKRLDELEPEDQAAALELMRSYGITPPPLAQGTGQVLTPEGPATFHAADGVERSAWTLTERRKAAQQRDSQLRGVGLHPGRDLTFEEATTILSAYEQGDLRRNAPAEEVEKLLRAEMGEASPAGVDEHQAVDRTPGGKRLDELEPEDQAAALELMRSHGIALSPEGQGESAGPEVEDPVMLPYDSRERRAATEATLAHIDNRDAVDAYMIADVSFAKPAAEAIAKAPGRAAVARPRPSQEWTQQTERGHDGQSR